MSPACPTLISKGQADGLKGCYLDNKGISQKFVPTRELTAPPTCATVPVCRLLHWLVVLFFVPSVFTRVPEEFFVVGDLNIIANANIMQVLFYNCN